MGKVAYSGASSELLEGDRIQGNLPQGKLRIPLHILFHL